jgi:hypothetical protein
MPAAPRYARCCGTFEAPRKVDAATEAEAVEKAAAEFKQRAPKLTAVRRGGAAPSYGGPHVCEVPLLRRAGSSVARRPSFSASDHVAGMPWREAHADVGNRCHVSRQRVDALQCAVDWPCERGALRVLTPIVWQHEAGKLSFKRSGPRSCAADVCCIARVVNPGPTAVNQHPVDQRPTKGGRELRRPPIACAKP